MNHVRHLVLFLLLLCSLTMYINRTNLNIAIVPMTTGVISSSIRSSDNETVVHYGCPAGEITNDTSPRKESAHAAFKEKRYDWDQVTQGKILGAFFYAYIIFMIPNGLIAERFGARWVIFVALAGPAVASFVVPFVTDYHYSMLMASRFLLGVFQSGFYPAAYGMVCNWFPLEERSVAFAVVDMATALGSVLTYIAAGTIVGHWGWSYLFFIPGVIAFCVSLLFLLGTRNQPEQHPMITEQEVKVIRLVVDEDDDTTSAQLHIKALSVPWLGILTNASVLSTMLFKFSVHMITTFIYLELPKYLNEVLHENISNNGSINASINIVYVISMTVCGVVSEKLIQTGCMSRTVTRKVFSFFTGTMTAVSFALIPVAGCRSSYLFILLCMCTFFSGFYTGSDVPIVSEMTINFPATLYALFNTIAMSAGFVVPYSVGLVLDSYEDPTAGWPLLFYSCAGLSIFATIVFIMFAKAERQPFDMISDEQHLLITSSAKFQRRTSAYL